MNLLIVDDDRSMRNMVARMASGWEYEVEESDNAEDALRRLETSRFSIILTDIRMGKMDGIELAERVRLKMPSTAVIIMTGFPSDKTAKKSQNMGAIYYMKKPIAMDELGGTLKIAAAWNIGMLVDRAAKRYLALRKGLERDQENRLKAIKFAIKRLLASPGWMAKLRDFVYAAKVEKNPLYLELSSRFSADSVNPF